MPLDPDLTDFSTASPVIASFPAVDLASGQSIVRYNGFTSISDTTKDYHIANFSPFSNNVDTGSVNSSSVTFVKLLDLDFDLTPNNLARTINGDIICQLGFGASGNSFTFYIIKVRTWDGVTEVEVANSQTLTHQSTGAWSFSTSTIKIPVSNLLIKKRMLLRITAEGWFKTSSSGETALAHSPNNRDGTNLIVGTNIDYSNFLIDVPYDPK